MPAAQIAARLGRPTPQPGKPKRNLVQRFWHEVDARVRKQIGPELYPMKRAGAVSGAGVVAGTVRITPPGQITDDGHDYPVLVHYTSTTHGGFGGPSDGDDAIKVQIDGVWYIASAVSH